MSENMVLFASITTIIFLSSSEGVLIDFLERGKGGRERGREASIGGLLHTHTLTGDRITT